MVHGTQVWTETIEEHSLTSNDLLLVSVYARNCTAKAALNLLRPKPKPKINGHRRLRPA